MNKKSKEISILGGGITGLVHAYYAEKSGYSVALWERSPRLGGMIQTLTTEFGTVEQAANGMLNSKITEELISDLGLSITNHKKASKRRYFFVKNRLKRIPVSPFSLIKAFISLIVKDATPHNEENMESWAFRILGKTFSKKLLEPALGGIYATPLESMNPAMVFSFLNFRKGRSLIQLFQERPKKIKPNQKGLISFLGGMSDLTNALIYRLEKSPNTKIFYSYKCKTFSDFIKENISNHITIINSNAKKDIQKKTKSSEIRVCVSLNEVYNLLKNDKFYHKYLKDFLNQPPQTFSIATVTRFGKTPLLKKPGFGILFPKGEGIQANGVLSNSSIFPGRISQAGFYSETWIYSGDWLKEIDTNSLEKKLEEDREQVLSAQKMDQSQENPHYFAKVWLDAFPVYNQQLIAFNNALDSIEKDTRSENISIRFFGNYRRGIGLRSIIESAYQSFDF